MYTYIIVYKFIYFLGLQFFRDNWRTIQAKQGISGYDSRMQSRLRDKDSCMQLHLRFMYATTSALH